MKDVALTDAQDQLAGIRGGLIEALQQVKRGELAEGDGPDAVRRAFAKARAAA